MQNMHVLIVIDARKHDFALGAAVYYALDELGWTSSPAIPFTFWREFDETTTEEALKEAIQRDVEYATIEANWAKFNYMYVICRAQPTVMNGSVMTRAFTRNSNN